MFFSTFSLLEDSVVFQPLHCWWRPSLDDADIALLITSEKR